MNSLVKDKYKFIDRVGNKKNLLELQSLFNKKCEEIEEYSPDCETYHKILDEMCDINDQIINYVPG